MQVRPGSASHRSHPLPRPSVRSFVSPWPCARSALVLLVGFPTQETGPWTCVRRAEPRRAYLDQFNLAAEGEVYRRLGPVGVVRVLWADRLPFRFCSFFLWECCGGGVLRGLEQVRVCLPGIGSRARDLDGKALLGMEVLDFEDEWCGIDHAIRSTICSTLCA